MKIAFFILIASSVMALGQTNLIISFTNASGIYVTNARVIKLMPNKIVYLTSNGGGMVRIDSLPDELRKQLNYDPALAKQADDMDQLHKQKEAERIGQFNRLRALQAQAGITSQTLISKSRTIQDKVLQKTKDGLLIDSGAADALDAKTRYSHDEKYNTDGTFISSITIESGELSHDDGPGSEHLGLVLLQDYPKESEVVDGSEISVLAYPIGTYTYTAVSGASKTISKYTADFYKAFLYWNQK